MADLDAKKDDVKEIAEELFQKFNIGTVKDLYLSPNPKFGNKKSGIVSLEFFDNEWANLNKNRISAGERVTIDSSKRRISWVLQKARDKKSKKPIEEESKKPIEEECECEACALERTVKEQQERIDVLEKRMQFIVDTLLPTESNATDRSQIQSHVQSQVQSQVQCQVQSNEDKIEGVNHCIECVFEQVEYFEFRIGYQDDYLRGSDNVSECGLNYLKERNHSLDIRLKTQVIRLKELLEEMRKEM